MNKVNEDFVGEFMNMIFNSWTYQKMTKKEKEMLHEVVFSNIVLGSLKGTKRIKWDILHSVYYAFLTGIGYDNFNWRSEDDE